MSQKSRSPKQVSNDKEEIRKQKKLTRPQDQIFADPAAAVQRMSNAPAELIRPSDILAAQQVIGNRAVQRWLDEVDPASPMSAVAGGAVVQRTSDEQKNELMAKLEQGYQHTLIEVQNLTRHSRLTSTTAVKRILRAHWTMMRYIDMIMGETPEWSELKYFETKKYKMWESKVFGGAEAVPLQLTEEHMERLAKMRKDLYDNTDRFLAKNRAMGRAHILTGAHPMKSMRDEGQILRAFLVQHLLTGMNQLLSIKNEAQVEG